MNEIASLLRYYPPVCLADRIEPLGNAGGMSGAQFWRITAPRGTLALRRWPKEHPIPDRLRFIHSVLTHAAQNGVPFLPLPIAARDGQTFIQYDGHLWELTPWLPGAADYDHSPNEEKLRAAMTALAHFHIAAENIAPPSKPATVPHSSHPVPAIDKCLTRLKELTNGGTEELSRTITPATWPEFAKLARQFIVTLPRAIPSAIAKLEPLANVPLPLQPCIRDIWHDHVLFTGDRVTGIIDFGAVDIDTPATDIARLVGSLSETPLPVREGPGEGSLRQDAWHEALTAYTAIRPLSQHESLAIIAIATAAPILAGCNWLRWIYVDGRQFADSAQIAERLRRITVRTRSI